MKVQYTIPGLGEWQPEAGYEGFDSHLRRISEATPARSGPSGDLQRRGQLAELRLPPPTPPPGAGRGDAATRKRAWREALRRQARRVIADSEAFQSAGGSPEQARSLKSVQSMVTLLGRYEWMALRLASQAAAEKRG